MARKATPTNHRLLFAQAACLCLGLSMLLWGLAPAIVERALTGRVPGWDSFAIGGGTVFIGLTFIGLHHLIRQRVRWALWAAFVAALALTTLVVGVLMAEAGQRPSLFLLVFAAGTTVTTWLAIGEGCQPQKSARG